MVEGSDDQDPTLEVPNFSAMSLWTKLVGDSRADYVKAFMAISHVKNMLRATDISTRYLTYNLFHWGYQNQTKATAVALADLDPKMQQAVFNDTLYGFNQIGTFKNWVLAYRKKNESAIYTEIFTHFQAVAKQLSTNFTQENMENIVGLNSMMSLLDRIYTQNLNKACGYDPSADNTNDTVNDQWSRGLLTKLKSIPIFDASNASLFQTSVQHLYNNDADQMIPGAFQLITGYEPEFYYFMRYKLGFTEEETEIDG